MLRRLSAIGLVSCIALGCQTQGQVPGQGKEQPAARLQKNLRESLSPMAK